MSKTIVTVPTYNESLNIVPLIDELLATGVPGLEILVIDDDSPDRTWALVDEAARRDTRVHLLRRLGERGRGTAGVAGFERALELGADHVFEMDADFSHQPRYLPAMAALLTSGSADVVIGSRYVAGGQDFDRGAARQLISTLARRYIQVVLGLTGVEDVTSGYRGFTRAALEAVQVQTLTSRGPSIVSEILFRASRRALRIREIPIEFIDRKRGTSTLTTKILIDNLLFMPKLRRRGW